MKEEESGTASGSSSMARSGAGADEPLANEPLANEPLADEPIANEPIADEPLADEPLADEPIANEPIADESKRKRRKNRLQPLLLLVGSVGLVLTFLAYMVVLIFFPDFESSKGSMKYWSELEEKEKLSFWKQSAGKVEEGSFLAPLHCWQGHVYGVDEQGYLHRFGTSRGEHLRMASLPDYEPGRSRVTFRKGRLYLQSPRWKGRKGELSIHFRALDLQRARVLWHREAPSAPWDYPRIPSPAAFIDDEVVFARFDGLLYSYGCEKGDLRWMGKVDECSILENFSPYLSTFLHWGRKCIVFASNGDSRPQLGMGQEQLETHGSGPELSVLHVLASKGIYLARREVHCQILDLGIGGDLVLALSGEGELKAFGLADLEPRWSKTGDFDFPFFVDGSRVILYDGQEKALVSLRHEDGRKEWSKKLSGWDSSLHFLSSDGVKLFLSGKKLSSSPKGGYSIICLDFSDGETRFIWDSPGKVLQSPGISGSKLFFSTDQGSIHCLSLDGSEEVRELWSREL